MVGGSWCYLVVLGLVVVVIVGVGVVGVICVLCGECYEILWMLDIVVQVWVVVWMVWLQERQCVVEGVSGDVELLFLVLCCVGDDVVCCVLVVWLCLFCELLCCVDVCVVEVVVLVVFMLWVELVGCNVVCVLVVVQVLLFGGVVLWLCFDVMVMLVVLFDGGSGVLGQCLLLLCCVDGGWQWLEVVLGGGVVQCFVVVDGLSCWLELFDVGGFDVCIGQDFGVFGVVVFVVGWMFVVFVDMEQFYQCVWGDLLWIVVVDLGVLVFVILVVFGLYQCCSLVVECCQCCEQEERLCVLQMLDVIVNGLFDLIFMCDLQGWFGFVNEVICWVLGWFVDVVLGCMVVELFVGDGGVCLVVLYVEVL